MSKLSLSRAWEETKGRVAADGRLMVIVAVALLLLPQALVTLLAPPADLSGVQPGSIGNLAAFFASLAGIAGQIAIIVLAVVPGTSVGEAIARGFARLLPVLGAIILIVIAIFIVLVPVIMAVGGADSLEAAEAGTIPENVRLAAGLILLLVLLLAPKLLLMMPVAANEQGGSIFILKRSWTLSSGHYWRLLGFMLLVLFAAIIIALAIQVVVGSVLVAAFGSLEPFSIGALIYGLVFGALQTIFAVLLTVMLARIYVQLAERSQTEVSVPSSGT